MNKDKTKAKRAGFTPGPFHVQLLSESKKLPYAIINDNIDVIARVHSEPDARLIASAPELYEQCKLFERMLVELQMQGETGVDYELEKLREVLAKADGGAEG